MRGKSASKNKLKPDLKYSNTTVSKFINYVMESGKKTIAQKIVYGSFDVIEEEIKNKKLPEDLTTPLQVFEAAIRNISPQIEVRGKRIGGANYQVPSPVRGERKFFLAFRWLIDSATKKKGRPMHEKLATELIAAANNEGDAIKKKEDTHRMAEANRAFAHFAR